MLQCKESLIQYGSIANLLPTDVYATDHIMGDCMHVATELDNDFTYDR